MNKKTVLTTAGVIVLGALGSALWELIKPLLSWGWSGLLIVATLGLDSLRDGMYADAANSLATPIWLGVAVKTLAGFVMLTGIAIVYCLRISSWPLAQLLARLYLYMLFFGAIVMVVGASRSAYVTQLASYYVKLETIFAPHISETELKKLRADYVQINNRAAYIAHINALQKSIESAGGKAPRRDFF